MYPVSQEYINKLYGISKKRRVVSALLDSVPFNEDDIIANTLKFTLQCVGGAEIKLGGVFLGQLWLTFTKSFAENITRGTWKGKEINLSIGLELSENLYEYIPIGKFIIEEANHTAKGVEVVCYDRMRRFDKELNFSSMSGSLYSMVSFTCNKCGVPLGMTEEQVEALANGTEVFSLYPDNDMTTYRDFLSWIAVTMGGYATINRAGEVELRSWKTTPLQTLGIDDRYAGGSWSDFSTFYTGLSITNIAEQTTTYISTHPDNGLTMNIGANPLLQYGLPETRTRQLQAILTALGNINYVPFRVQAFADPFFDLGDIVDFAGGLAGTNSIGCIMRIDFSFAKGVTLQGFGKNPALIGAQSKTDKNMAGIMAKNEENKTTFITFTNAEDIELEYDDSDGLQETPVATMYITPIKDTNLDINTRVIYTDGFVAGNTEQYVKTIKAIRYELDGDIIARVPYEDTPFCIVDNRLLGQERNNTIEDYQALLNVKAGDRKTLNVFLEYEVEGTATNQEAELFIGAGNINITLRGQGLSTEEAWDGIIRIEEYIPLISISGMQIEPLEDRVTVSLFEVQKIELSDSPAEAEIQALGVVDISEEFDITMVRPTFNTVDESGEYNLVTEDGLYNLVTE